jgi:Pvc16 N-terminal domain
MANVRALHSVGESLATYLGRAYGQTAGLPQCRFRQLSSHELADAQGPASPLLGIYLYRVSIDPHLRNTFHPRHPGMEPVPLSINLHYLLSVWAEDALTEQIALAWTMRELHLHPVLDASSLETSAAWERDEVLQLIPEELSNEDMMRIWDALTPSYRLSVSYIARVVRILPDAVPESRPVVATRFEHQDREVQP